MNENLDQLLAKWKEINTVSIDKAEQIKEEIINKNEQNDYLLWKKSLDKALQNINLIIKNNRDNYKRILQHI